MTPNQTIKPTAKSTGEAMKANMPKPSSDRPPPRKVVQVEFVDPKAKSVSIVGIFNGWRHDATPMNRGCEGRWIKHLSLAPGVYEYQLLVDGKWLPHPEADKTAPNPFGEVNSILTVTGPRNETPQLSP